MNQTALRSGKPTRIASGISFFRNPVVIDVFIAVVTYVLVLAMVLTAVSPKRYQLKAGDIAQEAIKAPRDVEDKLETQARIEQAVKNVPAIYRMDMSITEDVLNNLEEVFGGIKELRQKAEQMLKEQKSRQDGETGGELTLEDIVDPSFLSQNIRDFPLELSKEDLVTGITADKAQIEQLHTLLRDVLSELLDYGIKEENLLMAKNTIREEIQELPVSNEVKFLGNTIGVSLVRVNMKYDEEATELERTYAANQVERVIYKKGQHIVEAGQPVTENQIALLRELGLLKDDQLDLPMVIGIGIMILAVEVLIILYMVYFERELLKQYSMLIMISMIFCSVIGIALVTSRLHPYLVPTAMAAILLAVLLQSRISVIINIAISMIVGITLGNHLGLILMSLLGGMVGICMVSKPQQRNTLIFAGIAVSFVNIAVITGFELVSSGGWWQSFLTSLWGVGSGMLASVLAVGTLPIWEHFFKIITPIKLVEISNPNQPLLKRLLMEAPGTYHHSIIVANLAESAADAIGANGLLARVGAYYHDVGKLKRPYFFRENQLARDNPHDKMNPTLSTHIITSHVKDGVELAKQYKVPEVIQRFIQEHHGTTPVIYFYHKAKSEAGGREVKLDDFRYQGPRPGTREIAIVMMADTVEAASRALPDPSPGKLEGLIRKLIKDKLEDGQLDECDLTLKDLDSIAKAFSGVMSGIYHQRVQYPEVNLKDEKGEEQHDTAD